MRISVDAMGGDNAPNAIVEGCLLAVEKSTGFTIQLIGDEAVIGKILSDEGYKGDRIEIIHTSQVITGTDIPTKAIRQKKDSSIVRGLNMVKNKETDSFLSCGNTGALLTGAMLVTGRIKGIDRPALAPVIPTVNGSTMLIDAGLNTNCKLINYLQFATFGSIYMRAMFGIKKPKVGLLNVGAEETKGTEIVKEAFLKLKALEDIHFIGNVEGRDLIDGACDVAVCDGFVGNIVLKTYEGIGSFIKSGMYDIFMKNAISKMAAGLVKKDMKAFFKKLDYEEYGGTPILGVTGSVFKGHGSSKAKSIMFAIDCAVAFSKTTVIEEIKRKFINAKTNSEIEFV